MKKSVLYLLCVVLIASIILSPAALADYSDLTDVEGHWAEESLKKAYEDEVLIGYEDNTMRPDDPITVAEVMTILTRVLRAETDTIASGIGLSENDWYALQVSAAYELGMFRGTMDYESGMKRQDAFYSLASAFQLIHGEPDYSVLYGFTDSGSISSENKDAMASLVQDELVIGFDNQLTPNDNISRAEFVTMIYRLVEKVRYSGYGGSSFVMLPQRLADTTVDRVWVANDTSAIAVVNVNADLIAIRSENIVSSYFSGVNADRLAVAPECAYEVSAMGSSFGVISVGGVGGKITIAQNTPQVEVTSSGREIEIKSTVEKVIVSGDNNTVTIPKNSVNSVVMKGENNKLIIGGKVETVEVKGGSPYIDGTGAIGTLKVYDTDYKCNVSCGETLYFGLLAASVDLTAPESLPAGEKLVVKAKVNGAELKDGYTAYWTFNGVKGQEFKADLTLQNEFVFEYEYEYTYNMDTEGSISFTIVDSSGNGDVRSDSATFQVENYPPEHYYDKDILKVVTTGYKGNRTLKWAQEHDYTDFEKELWVNTKGYQSDTKYLIWVSIAYQRCNVFEKTDSGWQLIRSGIVATGAPGTDTPVGVYKTTYKQTGWYTSSYTCYPVVRFYAGTGYAFHSRLYEPGSKTVLQDSRIGFPISLGCIRMYNEDIQWLYDNIPTNTTVVVY